MLADETELQSSFEHGSQNKVFFFVFDQQVVTEYDSMVWRCCIVTE